MGFFDDLFESESAFHEDVDRPMLMQRLDRLELLCKALTELVVSKGLATREELSVVTQQLDLADGVEDGKIGARVRKNAPRCASCGRFVNPRRSHCVYCHAAVLRNPSEVPPERSVVCAGCNEAVPESGTFYTAGGLRCDTCFEEVLP